MLTLQDIHIPQQIPTKHNTSNCKWNYIDFEIPDTNLNVIGIDPGVNFGIASIHGGFVRVGWGKFTGKKEPGERGHQVFLEMFKANNYQMFSNGILCVIEGAAYNKFHGQVLLEEVRMGFYLAFRLRGAMTKIVAPATIKSKILGNGRGQAGDQWPWLNHNAADAISIALYGQYLQPCGHPTHQIVSSTDGTHYCKECAEEESR